MGDPDPLDFVNLETNRIPFQTSDLSLDLWQDTFRSWPTVTPGWRDWYRRLNAADRLYWDEADIGQCIDLSLAHMTRNEPLLQMSSYFWSDALNAFLFGHGPMTPTLIDVVMMTGLNITAADNCLRFGKCTHRLETRKIGGWKGYIGKYNPGSGAINARERTAFFTMWLEKFFFCGKSAGPTTNCQAMAEVMASNQQLPLGKYLLGAVYRLLHQVGVCLRRNKPIGNPGGPWWFIQIWLNAYMHKIAGIDLKSIQFPASSFAENEEFKTRGALSIGEAASQIVNDPSAVTLVDYFKVFYHGFSDQDFSWFIYTDVKDTFSHPTNFDMTDTNDEYSTKILSYALVPRILPVDFTSIKDKPSYEFYHPAIAARQMGFGQLPIHLYLTSLIRSRELLNSALELNRLQSREPATDSLDLNQWIIIPFTSILFSLWWGEWSKHLFSTPVSSYLQHIATTDPDDDSEVNT